MIVDDDAPDDDTFDPATAALPPVSRVPRVVRVQGPVVRGASAASTSAIALPLPGSKYLTLRYLLNAFLAAGESRVLAPALSDDTAVLVVALRALGADVRWEHAPDAVTGERVWSLRVRGVGGRLHTPVAPLGMGNAGAVLRLLLGIGALLPAVRFETDHPDSLGRRPNADLLDALRQLGIATEAREPDGLLPIALRGGPPRGGAVRVSGARSSQYLSALLYLGPLLMRGLEITVTDELRSSPLVRATLAALAAAGIAVTSSPDLRHLTVPGGQTFATRDYAVPGDGPTAAALAAAALALGVPLRLGPLTTGAADIRALLAALSALGAEIAHVPDAPGAIVISPLRSVGEEAASAGDTRITTIDGDACIDSVPALVAAACCVRGETRFERVETLRFKESDRIGDLCAELARAGADITPGADTIVVRGRPDGLAGGVTVAGHDDHRLVQALAIAALRSADALTITGADAVAKSYPGYFDALGRLGARVRAVEGPAR
ncbi:MAG: 3-phosphoshikimate 1-carboxyvinyltransferase [Ktedonobacterales bacterium]